MAETRAVAEKAFDFFLECLWPQVRQSGGLPGQGPRRRLLAFYDFPAEHWKHIRTTNPIESTFAQPGAPQDHHDQGLPQPHERRSTMVFKLCQSASKKASRVKFKDDPGLEPRTVIGDRAPLKPASPTFHNSAHLPAARAWAPHRGCLVASRRPLD